jgi:hypothetical protein
VPWGELASALKQADKSPRSSGGFHAFVLKSDPGARFAPAALVSAMGRKRTYL